MRGGGASRFVACGRTSGFQKTRSVPFASPPSVLQILIPEIYFIFLLISFTPMNYIFRSYNF